MGLTQSEVSMLLMMPEKELAALVRKKEIPFEKVKDTLLFNRQKIINWALDRSMPMNLSGSAKMAEYSIGSVLSVLDKKNFFYGCSLDEKNYLEQMVGMADLGSPSDKRIIIQLLKSREKLMSTAVGNGVALPHPRVPIITGRERPVAAFFFPEKELMLDSVDKKPVHTVILLISQSIKQHLGMLAHFMFLLSKPAFLEALRARADFENITRITLEAEKEHK